MISVQIDDSPFRDQVRLLSYRMRDLTPVLEGVGAALESNVRNRFESRTDPDGMPWAPWAQSTRETYPEGGNRRLLDRLGDMLNGVSYQLEGDASVRVGFDKEYATYHEWGTEHMPRRGLLMSDPDQGTLSEDDTATVLAVLNDFINDLNP